MSSTTRQELVSTIGPDVNSEKENDLTQVAILSWSGSKHKVG